MKNYSRKLETFFEEIKSLVMKLRLRRTARSNYSEITRIMETEAKSNATYTHSEFNKLNMKDLTEVNRIYCS